MPDSTDTPRATYDARLQAWRAQAATLGLRERRLSNARMATFLSAVALLWIGIDTEWLSPWWALLPLAGFVGLVGRHDRVIRARQRAERAAAYHDQGLARVEDRWAGQGNPGDSFLDPKHPYAIDLDLFGPGSLFERVCSARTLSGEATLARWLLQPAACEEVAARQAAVAELSADLDLREALAIAGEDVRVGLDIDILGRWSAAAPLPDLGRWRGLALGAVGLCGLSTLAWPLGLGPLPLGAAVLLAMGLTRRLRPHVQRIVSGVQHPYRDLGAFAEILELLESRNFSSPKLRELRARLETEGEAASARIARLRRLVHLLDALKNQLFAPIGLLLLWDTHVALAIEAWRVRFGAAIGEWLAAVGEIEALGSLATFAFEDPEATYPTLEATGPLFEAQGLGHPLLPSAQCVRNDVRLGEPTRVLIVSGSNMSGKSTLLRAVGINTVLALAGAPVRARTLRLSPVGLGASIRTLDSLREGTSRFYAEIKRLRQVMDLAGGKTPLLFLLDEVLHGTNSHDRGIGAEALVRGFLARGAIGLVTTHDLALARVGDELAPTTANVHFEDYLQEGEMRFDYTMRPGVVTHSNALALMRAVGLAV